MTSGRDAGVSLFDTPALFSEKFTITKSWQVESLVSLLKILVPVRVVAAHHRQQHFYLEDICWRDSEDVL